MIQSTLRLVAASFLLAAGAQGQAFERPQAVAVGEVETISIAVKDGDLAEVLRLFARVGRMNLVLDPAVRGRTVTITLDAVPWDQAMSVVLQSQGLGSANDGNVVRVAPVAKLIGEENQMVQLREAREQSGELRTIAVSLSNADATQAEAILRKGLTPRGTTAIDKRTNTIFITDVFPGGDGGGDMLELAPIPPGATAPPAAADFEVRLLEVDGLSADGANPASQPGARMLGSARVVLGLAQRATLVLGDAAEGTAVTMTLSPQLDGGRAVLVVRATSVAAEGMPVGRALPIGSEQVIAMPGRTSSGRSLVLSFVPR